MEGFLGKLSPKSLLTSGAYLLGSALDFFSKEHLENNAVGNCTAGMEEPSYVDYYARVFNRMP